MCMLSSCSVNYQYRVSVQFSYSAMQRFNIQNIISQGRNEVRWRPGAKSKLSAPMFEPTIIWKQMYCIKESTCDIAGTFQRPPQPFGAPI